MIDRTDTTDLSVGGRREALCAGLRRDPDDLVDRVAMTVFDERHVDRLWALASVPVQHLSVVLTTDQDVRVLWVVLHTDQRGPGGSQRHLRLVGVLYNDAHNVRLPGFAANSKYKIQALFKDFKDPNCIFQAPKLSAKRHILDVDIQNLDCNILHLCDTEVYCTVLTNTVTIKPSDRLPSSICL